MMSQNNDKMKLLNFKTSEEILREMQEGPHTPELWYDLGMAIADEKGLEAAIEVFSQGLIEFPFSDVLYFARGRRCIGLRKYILAIADATMALRLNPYPFSHWYYRALPRYLNHDYSEAISDLMQCLRILDDDEKYPVYVWLFRCYVESGQFDKAQALLDSVDTSIPTNRMDYGYRREFQLFKREVTPENLIDIDDIEKHSLVNEEGIDHDARMRLEIESITFALFTYYTFYGDEAKANEALKKMMSFEPSAAFSYLSARGFAEERQLI